MKPLLFTCIVSLSLFSCKENEQKAPDLMESTQVTTATNQQKLYYIDVHEVDGGKVAFADVAGAHEKDLATQSKYDVQFKKYWVAEDKGKIYCLSQADNAGSVEKTHKDAHGLMPVEVYEVSQGTEAAITGNKPLYMDVHHMGPGKVTAKDVAGAHDKDLAVQGKHGVNFINYYVDEKKGVIMCLSEAKDSNAVKSAHKEAHGLVPAYVVRVKQGE